MKMGECANFALGAEAGGDKCANMKMGECASMNLRSAIEGISGAQGLVSHLGLTKGIPAA